MKHVGVLLNVTYSIEQYSMTHTSYDRRAYNFSPLPKYAQKKINRDLPSRGEAARGGEQRGMQMGRLQEPGSVQSQSLSLFLHPISSLRRYCSVLLGYHVRQHPPPSVAIRPNAIFLSTPTTLVTILDHWASSSSVTSSRRSTLPYLRNGYI